MISPRASALTLFLIVAPAHALDVTELWVAGDPVASEARMLAALESAHGDDALIIRTQIARTYVFRKDFSRAHEILRDVETELDSASPEAQARYWLELGRSYASHQQAPGSQTDETRALARHAYENAVAIASDAGLDGLTVDALHMLPFTETDLTEQMYWTQRALELVLESDQPEARRWEASIRSNLGEIYFDLAQYPQALEQFESSRTLRQRDGASYGAVRDANWHVARTLRMLGQLERALEIQQRLADEAYVANEQRHYIHDELSLLYAALDDAERARHFAEHSAALQR